jgi:hypothetical protein
MLRFLPREETSELWGLDINAAHIEWCQQNLKANHPQSILSLSASIPPETIAASP